MANYWKTICSQRRTGDASWCQQWILPVRHLFHSQTFLLTWPVDTIDTIVQNKNMNLRYVSCCNLIFLIEPTLFAFCYSERDTMYQRIGPIDDVISLSLATSFVRKSIDGYQHMMTFKLLSRLTGKRALKSIQHYHKCFNLRSR